MVRVLKEFQLIFEGTVVFTLLTQVFTNFFNHPSLFLIPEVVAAMLMYIVYRTTASLLYKSMEKINQAKKKKSKLERRIKKKRGT